MSNTKNLLEDVIEQQLSELASLTPGSDEMSMVIDDVVKLYRLKLEEDKNSNEHEEKRERRMMDEKQNSSENKFKERQLSLEESKQTSDQNEKSERRDLDNRRLEVDKTLRNRQIDIDEKKIYIDRDEHIAQRDIDEKHKKFDEDLRTKEFECSKKNTAKDQKYQMYRDIKILMKDKTDIYLKYGTAAAEIILTLTFYAIWMRKGFKFEETGTFGSSVFKGLISKFKPTRK